MRAFAGPLMCALLAAGSACGTPDPAPAESMAPAVVRPAAGVGAPVVPLERGQLRLSTPVLFETGRDVLKPESDDALNEVREFLAARPDVTLLRIECHADTDGNAAASQGLTERRALSVARWLVAKGVDCRRLLPAGFGGSKPAADNGTPEGKAQNRRTAFVPAALRGLPIGGLPVDGGGRVAGDPCGK